MRETVGIADRGGRAFTLLDGADAVKFLQGMVTNDVDGIAVGSAAYALLLTPKARVVADMRLTRLGATTFLADADQAAAAALRTVLTRYRLASKVAIEVCDDRFGIIAVAGPRAAALLGDALGVAPAEGAEGTGTEIALATGVVHALRSAFSGEEAFELIGPRDALDEAWQRLAAALPQHDGRVFGEEAFDVLRVEAGVPRFGAEIDEQVMPAEAGVVDRAVSFTKGCYIGQEPVARLHYRGHANRGLRSIAARGRPPGRRRDRRGRGSRGRAHHVVGRVADDRPDRGAGDRPARGLSRPAGRRRHRGRRARGGALRRARVPVARLRC